MSVKPEQFQGIFEVLPFVGALSGALTATAGSEAAATVTVTGAVPGDIVIAAIVEDTESGTLTAQVNNNDLVEFVFSNATASTITIGTGTVARGVVLRLKEGIA